jgi:hypothetical protein
MARLGRAAHARKETTAALPAAHTGAISLLKKNAPERGGLGAGRSGRI